MNGIITALRLLSGVLLAAAVCSSQSALPENSVLATLSASVTPDGVLHAAMTVVASGSLSQPYRGPLMRDEGAASSALFGNFVRNRQLQSGATVTDADQPDRPVQIRFTIQDPDFILPIHRQQSLVLDLVPLAPPSTTSPLSAPGRFHEEVTLAVPPDFRLRAESHRDEDRVFAHYKSDAKIEGDQLILIRELVIKQPGSQKVEQAELESFWKIVREDQQKSFILMRTRNTNASAWIDSLTASQASAYGHIAYQQREYDAARQLYERVLRSSPNDKFAWNSLGRTLMALGDLEGAQKAYERQISINPKDAYSYNNLGLAQERLGHWDQAVDSLRKQLEVHPGDTYAIGNLPRALVHLGRWAEVESAANKALEIQPENSQQKLNLAIARVCQDKTAAAEARREVDAALGAQPTALLLNNAGYYLTQCGKEFGLAETYARRALDMTESASAAAKTASMSKAIGSQNSLCAYLDTYGWLLFQQGKVDQAIGILAPAAEMAPSSDIYEHLAQAEWKAGRQTESILHWRETTFLEPAAMAHVPKEIVSRLASVAPLSLDRVWRPLPSDSLAALVGDLPRGIPAYFYVSANSAGKVETARELGAASDPGTKALTLLRAVPFPKIEADGRALSTVFLVKVASLPDGKVFAARSTASAAVAIASELEPEEFPLPATAPAPPAAVNANKGKGPAIIAPRALQKVGAVYSESARKAHLTGIVLVQLLVGTDGAPRNLRVTQSLGLGLDEKALAAAAASRYSPALLDGKAVNATSTFEARFNLANSAGATLPWHLDKAEIKTPEGATSPEVRVVDESRLAIHGDGASARVTFDINEQGSTTNCRVEQTSNQGWAKDVVAALAKWKFTPAMRDGRPFLVSATMNFVRGN